MSTLMIFFMLTAGISCLILFDLHLAWNYYRNSRSSATFGWNFIKWWVSKNIFKLAAAGGVLLLTLLSVGGVWIAHRYDLFHFGAETSGYMENAQHYFTKGKYREATLELRNAIKQNRGDFEAQLWLARSYAQLGEVGNSRNAYQDAIRIEPQLYAAHLELARLDFAAKDLTAAFKGAKQALLLAPQEREPRLLLARLYQAEGGWNKAVEQYRAILDVNPANQEVRRDLISLLLSHHACSDAGREAEAGIRQHPRDTGFQVSLAIARAGEGRYDEAVLILRDAAAHDTESPLPLIALGDLQYRAGNLVPALQSYENALKRSPTDERLTNNIAVLHAEHGYELERAATLASRLYHKYPRAPAFADTMGWVLFKQGKVGQALPLLRQAVAGEPEAPEHHYHLGSALLKDGDSEAGRNELETALKISDKFDGADKARVLLGKRS